MRRHEGEQDEAGPEPQPLQRRTRPKQSHRDIRSPIAPRRGGPAGVFNSLSSAIIARRNALGPSRAFRDLAHRVSFGGDGNKEEADA
jgi:hypothetical protein